MEQTLTIVRRSMRKGRPTGSLPLSELIATHVYIPWGNYEWRNRHVEALRRLGFRFGYLELPSNLVTAKAGLGFYSEELWKMLEDQKTGMTEITPPLELKI